MDDQMGRDRNTDLVLPPSTYAYVLDTTKGKVSVYVGPYKNSLSNTDQLVAWEDNKFREVSGDRAVYSFRVAREGQYIVLNNPPADGMAPTPPKGSSTDAIDLDVGRQVNVPGPATFPLWPGQTAQTIDGHHLRHNQYLVVRVYDAAQAVENWESAVVAPQMGADGSPSNETDSQPPTYAMGQLIVVAGTQVSFYIPPTGIEVVPEANGVFTREAVTLERLEYCILLDENGDKRYARGPDVVFPRPTEKFVEKASDGVMTRKFRAIELNPHSGLFIKVIAEYTDEAGVNHPVGEELFITGEEQAIYFPRAEHSLIQYGDKRVHHAVAIPAGEGRYVLDRDSGTVDLITGPKMFLPDPRREVVVLRILDPHVVKLLFPGNQDALNINAAYSELSSRLDAGQHLSNIAAAAAMDPSSLSYASASSGEGSLIGTASRGFSGDTMRRGSTYSPPRSIVLDTKYEGAVMLNIWPGYAVLVVNKTDDRRVELGPKSVLLQYDETLMPLTLSTGRPKNDNNLLRTAYLRIVNNQVSDRVEVETRDLVTVTLDISYRVNFEGDDHEKWFSVENYVKVLTDHCRSRLRNVAKRHGIQEFYTDTIDIIRDTLLGEATDTGRTGLPFTDNGMVLFDVEVLGVSISDSYMAELLVEAQTSAVKGAIELSTSQERTVRNAQLEELARKNLLEVDKTHETESQIAIGRIGRQLEQRLADLALDLEAIQQRQKVEMIERAGDRLASEQDLELETAANEVALARLVGETTEYLRRIESLNPHLVVALQQFGDQNFVEKLVSAVGPAAIATGVTSADLFAKIFQGTPFEGALGALTERPLANGHRTPVVL